MTPAETRELVTSILACVEMTRARLRVLEQMIPTATRYADRLSLAATASSLRLELEVTTELLRDLQGSIS